MLRRNKESDLFLPVKNWLELHDWEVYAEVTGFSGRADMVGLHKNSRGTVVIELKTSLTDKVIEQAIGWLGTANYIYVAVLLPARGSLNISRVKGEILNKYGIGVIAVDLDRFNYHMSLYDEYSYQEDTYLNLCNDIENSLYSTYFSTGKYYGITIEKRAKYQKIRYKRYWENVVHPLMKDSVGGTESSGGYVTDYKITILSIKRYLINKYKEDKMNLIDEKMCGMATVAMICKNCDTHYAQPKSGVMNALTNFEKDTFDRYSINRKVHFRLKDNVIKEMLSGTNLKMF